MFYDQTTFRNIHWKFVCGCFGMFTWLKLREQVQTRLQKTKKKLRSSAKYVIVERFIKSSMEFRFIWPPSMHFAQRKSLCVQWEVRSANCLRIRAKQIKSFYSEFSSFFSLSFFSWKMRFMAFAYWTNAMRCHWILSAFLLDRRSNDVILVRESLHIDQY